MFPVKNFELDENDNISGQTSIEKDFPEYMPEEQLVYATSHKEIVKEMEELAKQADCPIYEGDVEIDYYVPLSKVIHCLHKFLG